METKLEITLQQRTSPLLIRSRLLRSNTTLSSPLHQSNQTSGPPETQHLQSRLSAQPRLHKNSTPSPAFPSSPRAPPHDLGTMRLHPSSLSPQPKASRRRKRLGRQYLPRQSRSRFWALINKGHGQQKEMHGHIFTHKQSKEFEHFNDILSVFHTYYNC